MNDVLMAVTGMVWDGTGMLYRIFFFLLCALHYAAIDNTGIGNMRDYGILSAFRYSVYFHKLNWCEFCENGCR